MGDGLAWETRLVSTVEGYVAEEEEEEEEEKEEGRMLHHICVWGAAMEEDERACMS